VLAVPLALPLAARIGERRWEEFVADPTQLANGLRDLLDAVRPDGVPVTMPDVLGPGAPEPARLACAVEATRRLRASVRDDAVLLAVLPVDDEAVLVDTVRTFLEAGVDGVLLAAAPSAGAARTIGNVARFHRAMAHVLAGGADLPAAETVDLGTPRAATGLVVTDGEVPAAAGVPAVQHWVETVRG
jgi:hypothetical protein